MGSCPNRQARQARIDMTIFHIYLLDQSPLTATELETYFETCINCYSRYYPLFLTLSRTGMRLSEALGLQWNEIDFNGHFIEIKQDHVENRTTTPKSGKKRRVEMSPQLEMVLNNYLTQCKRDALQKGWGKISKWVFHNQEGKRLDAGNLRTRIHYKICEKAKLRSIRIHDLRHSYATIRISAGHNLADVSRQLGHASIKITVDTYYYWIPNQTNREVDELDNLGKNETNRTLSAPTK